MDGVSSAVCRERGEFCRAHPLHRTSTHPLYCAGYPIHSYNPLLMHHPGPIEHILPHLPILLIFVFGIGSRMVFRMDLTINIWN